LVLLIGRPPFGGFNPLCRSIKHSHVETRRMVEILFWGSKPK
jgi:hypothetical protein